MTSDAKFTPGPWELKTLEPNTLGQEWVDSSDVRTIADCSQANRIKNGFPCHMEDGETKANARLIAAAPTQHAALQELWDVCDDLLRFLDKEMPQGFELRDRLVTAGHNSADALAKAVSS